ncbi:hypothetical protein GCM10027605_38630 [Micromonospora zhanjiangensis]
MKSLFTAGSWASRRSARRVLAALLSAVGRAGLAAAADRPGLLAAVDQHTAAVRDALVPGPAAGRSTPPPALLAAYAEGSGTPPWSTAGNHRRVRSTGRHRTGC